MNAKVLRLDVSLICFVLVIAAAIPVALLRTKTYALGYELGRLKAEERDLRQRNVELLSELASAQRAVRDKYIVSSRLTSAPKADLLLPQAEGVIHGKGNTGAR